MKWRILNIHISDLALVPEVTAARVHLAEEDVAADRGDTEAETAGRVETTELLGVEM